MPKPVREALGVEPGDRVRYFIMDDEVRIVPVRPIRRLFGAFKRNGPARTLEDMDRAIAAGPVAPVEADPMSPI